MIDEKIKKKQEKAIQRVKNYIMFYINKYPSTTKNKIIQKIKSAKCYDTYTQAFETDKELIELVDWYEELNIINDKETVRAKVYSKINAGWSVRKIRSQLPMTIQSNINEVNEAIELYLSENNIEDTNELDFNLVYNDLEKRESKEKLSCDKYKDKITRRYIGRGFSYSVVNEAMKIFLE